jgi:hypothetical protein
LVYVYDDFLHADERELLDRLPGVQELKAEFGDVKPCLPNTRVELLDQLYRELKNIGPDDPQIIWLHGLAGSGKSTISTTVARKLDEDGALGANFFFSRFDTRRSDPAVLFAALARQLGHLPSLKKYIIQSLKTNDVDIGKASLYTQFMKLIVRPLQAAEGCLIPVIVVLDALDECNEPRLFLDILEQHINNLPPFFKIIATSRFEEPMRSTFRRMGNAVQTRVLERTSSGDADIRRIFQAELSRVANREGLPGGMKKIRV